MRRPKCQRFSALTERNGFGVRAASGDPVSSPFETVTVFVHCFSVSVAVSVRPRNFNRRHTRYTH